MRPLLLLTLITFLACDASTAEDGKTGLQGPPGPAGEPGPPGPPGFDGARGPQGGSTVKSGTRLKAIVARSEDGASQFLNKWWDSKFEVECERSQINVRSKVTVGVERLFYCIPPSILNWDAEDRQVYADSDCLEYAMPEIYRFCQVYIYETQEGGEKLWDVRFYEPSNKIVEQLYTLVDGECRETDPPAFVKGSPTWRICGDLPAIELEEFAAMPEVVESF